MNAVDPDMYLYIKNTYAEKKNMKKLVGDDADNRM